jgi:hypothetical protein
VSFGGHSINLPPAVRVPEGCRILVRLPLRALRSSSLPSLPVALGAFTRRRFQVHEEACGPIEPSRGGKKLPL